MRPKIFQAAASLVLWKCYCSLGTPCEAVIDQQIVMRLVDSESADRLNESDRDLAVECTQVARSVHHWLEREGFIRKTASSSYDAEMWELTMLGLSALSRPVDFGAAAPKRSIGETLTGYFGGAFEAAKEESQKKIGAGAVHGIAAIFANILG